MTKLFLRFKNLFTFLLIVIPIFFAISLSYPIPSFAAQCWDSNGNCFCDCGPFCSRTPGATCDACTNICSVGDGGGSGDCGANCPVNCTGGSTSGLYIDTNNAPVYYLYGIFDGSYPNILFRLTDTQSGATTDSRIMGDYGNGYQVYWQRGCNNNNNCWYIPNGLIVQGRSYAWAVANGSGAWWCYWNSFWVSGPPQPLVTCSGTNPDTPILVSPGNPGNTLVGTTTVNLSWNDINSWGTNSCGNTDKYTVYLDTNANPTTSKCTVTSGQSPACSVSGLSDQTTYYWKVIASNGLNSATSDTWSFTIKQPVIQGTLYEDSNRDACWQNPGEQTVSIGTISVSANGIPGYCTKPTAQSYKCVVPVAGANDIVNLSSSSFSPPYTAQTGCSTGTNSCGLNNCSPSVSPGDNLTLNLGFSVKPWFQTSSCSAASGGDLISLLPQTPLDYDTNGPASSYLVLNQAGVVSAAKDLLLGNGQASLPNYQAKGYASDLSRFKYTLIKQKLGSKSKPFGSGLTVSLSGGKLIDGATSVNITNNSVWDISGSLDIVDSSGLNNVNSVLLVSGTITVWGNFTPASSSLAFISKGAISVKPAVTQINGIYFTDASFSDGATTDQGLKVVGSVGAQNGINLQRLWQNTYKPAEYFVCDPSLYINLSPTLGTPSINWQEVAP